MYDAIVLAGGVSDAALDGEGGCEAMLDIAGRPMVSYVVGALAKSGRVNRIFTVGPARHLQNCAFAADVRVLEGGATIIESIQTGFSALDGGAKTLVATADIPLLTPAAVTDFLTRCEARPADLYYPVVARRTIVRRFPTGRRTYFRLRDGVYTGGNLFLADPRIVPRCLAVAGKVVANRKKPWRVAGLLGWRFLLSFFCGRLTLEAAERRASAILGVRGAAVCSPYPEIGMDVDKRDDLELARQTLAGQDNQ